jgi:phosphoribosylformylglycinamidine synthase II
MVEITEENLEEILKNHSLTNEDYEHIIKILDRKPNFIEIGIFSAMWSEHCSYKSSKVYLNGFPTKAPWVIQGPGENAGIIDIGDGYGAVFKMESHNHPSFIEPYQGAATGVGGILRDVFTMGARPVANMNSIRFANIDRKDEVGKKHRYLLKGVVEGIGGYGNCMGVPTIGGETTFEDCYAGNNLVNAFTLGVVKNDEIFLGKADGIGNPIIYVGSKTGRDGLGGAVMSSNSFDDDSASKRPTVQVGDPFTEKLLLEACLELFKANLIVGIQDMGAAGLTSSSFEMADRSGTGLVMHLDTVPAREEKMHPYEFMLSESQERMLVCAKKGTEEEIIKIFEKWDLDVAVIGEVTDTKHVELFWEGEKCADIPVAPIVDEAPMLTRPTSKPTYLDEIKDFDFDSCNKPSNQEAFEKLISNIEIVDKSWIYEQYDSMVQTNTISGCGKGDASVIRVKENGKALAMSADCNTRQCFVDPKLGAAAAVMESGRNIASMGGVPKAITDCLNYGNPQNPEVMWQFKEGCEGIKEACKTLDTPVIGGNVSLYNETNEVSVYPTPSIAMVGIIDNPENIISSSFKNENSNICVLGDTKSEFGASLYMKLICDKVAGVMPEVDLNKELNLWKLMEKLANEKLVNSSKDCSNGGIAIALAKMTANSDFGIEANFESSNGLDIFSESLSRIIIEVSDENLEKVANMAKECGIECVNIGKTNTSNEFKLNDICMDTNKLKDVYFNTFKEIIEQDM